MTASYQFVTEDQRVVRQVVLQGDPTGDDEYLTTLACQSVDALLKVHDGQRIYIRKWEGTNWSIIGLFKAKPYGPLFDLKFEREVCSI